MSNDNLSFTQDKITFREITSKAGLRQAYRLRYEICVDLLGWIEGDAIERIETDEFDAHSYHFGCYRGGELVGYMRLTPEDSPEGIMSRKYFSDLWHREPGYEAALTGDLSRLIVSRPILADKKLLKSVLLGLYQLAYQRSQLLPTPQKYWYFVTSKRMIYSLRFGLLIPVKVIGHGVTSDGKRTYVVALDLGKARKRLQWIAPARLRTFEGGYHLTSSSMESRLPLN